MRLNRSLCRAALVLPVLLLSACTVVGPDYRVPDEALIQQESAHADFASADAPPYTRDDLPRDWWRLYRDAQLDGLIEAALKANTDLRIASANLARSRAILDEARSMTDPIFDVSAAPTYGRSATASGTRRQADHWFYDVGGGMSYQFDLFGKIARAIEAAAADVEATRSVYDMVRITVIADTTRAYLDICSSNHRIAVAEHSLALQQTFVNSTVRLARGGRATTLDVSRSRAQLEQLRAAVPPLQAQHRTALFQLAVLTGSAPNTLTGRVGQCRAAPRLTSPIPVGNGADMLRRRPDIRQAERELAAATARIGVATADLYPSIRIGLSTGITGVFSDFSFANAFRWSVGPLISWTIPATGPARSRVAQAEAVTQAALAYFDGVVLNALKEVESALTLYARELDRNAALRESRNQGKLAARQAHRLYDYGRTDFLTTLDADRTLASLESALAESDAQLVRNRVNLFLALGGGWNPEASRDENFPGQGKPEQGDTPPS
ncbi:MAG: TolC family protein [Burkholderiaceae bacterium]|jgi:NodT family efflux transporter outer membrane factor (OMF) lipoprotein|nr:TolC family protein [Burkholderiaceae bacterium]